MNGNERPPDKMNRDAEDATAATEAGGTVPQADDLREDERTVPIASTAKPLEESNALAKMHGSAGTELRQPVMPAADLAHSATGQTPAAAAPQGNASTIESGNAPRAATAAEPSTARSQPSTDGMPVPDRSAKKPDTTANVPATDMRPGPPAAAAKETPGQVNGAYAQAPGTGTKRAVAASVEPMQAAAAQAASEAISPPDVIVADTHLIETAPPLNREHVSELLPDTEAERRIRAMSRRSFLWGAGAVAATVVGINWLATRRQVAGVQWPFRRLLEVNEGLSRDFYSGARLAPQFPKSMATMPRANGEYGVASEIDPNWKLQLVGLADMSKAKMPDTSTVPDMPDPGDNQSGSDQKPGPPDKKQSAHPDKKGGKPPPAANDTGQDESDDTQAGDNSGDSSDTSDSTSDSADATASPAEPAVMVTLQEIKKLPRTEIVTELKCIEGWSTIVHWAGVALVDFLKHYPPATKSGKPFDPTKLDDLPEYVSMETPDKAYYVGLDMASALHPQTVLCYEMNGQPLAAEHGAPLRLAIPVKYGIKNIKNIGKIKFTDERPKDYWAEQGYDWYAGH